VASQTSDSVKSAFNLALIAASVSFGSAPGASASLRIDWMVMVVGFERPHRFKDGAGYSEQLASGPELSNCDKCL